MLVFFGPDGSGKTTIVRTLATWLSYRGFKVKISWMRGTHTISSILANLLNTFSILRGRHNPYYGISIPLKLRRLWQFIEFISILPILILRFYLPAIFGRIIICDRFTPDFIIWVALTTNDPSFLDSIYAKFLLRLSGKACANIYVTADLKELLRRKQEYDVSFIKRQLILYEKVAKMVGAFKLDTTKKTVKESFEEILKVIEPCIQKH